MESGRSLKCSKKRPILALEAEVTDIALPSGVLPARGHPALIPPWFQLSDLCRVSQTWFRCVLFRQSTLKKDAEQSFRSFGCDSMSKTAQRPLTLENILTVRVR